MATRPGCVWLQCSPPQQPRLFPKTVIKVKMIWSLSQPLLQIRGGKYRHTMRGKKECVQRICVCDQTVWKQGVTGWVNGVEEDMAPIPLPVLYILKYTNVFNWVDPIYYESRLISLICVEKISIYKARSPVKWGRECEKETEIWRDSGSERGREQEKERT